MQEIILMKKSIHWFMNNTVEKNRDIKSTAEFSPLVNHLVPPKIRNLADIIQTFGKQDDKHYLWFNFEFPDVDGLE